MRPVWGPYNEAESLEKVLFKQVQVDCLGETARWEVMSGDTELVNTIVRIGILLILIFHIIAGHA